MEKTKKPFLQAFAEKAAKIGENIYLRTLKDSFATLIPFYVVGGIAVFLGNVLFPYIFKGTTLENVQRWSNFVSNSSIGVTALLAAPVIAYFFSQNKNYKNKLAAAVMALSVFSVLQPENIKAAIPGKDNATTLVTKAIHTNNLGVQGLFAAIVVGLFATAFFIKISSIKKLQINLGEMVPQAISDSFNVLIPMMITLGFFALISVLLSQCFGTDFFVLIGKVLQQPLKTVGTSLPGCLLICFVANLLFAHGIHMAVIYGAILEPLLIININENTAAFKAGESIPNIINHAFYNIYGVMGGSGCTICLIIAALIVSKYKPSKTIVKMATVPGLFNINEPIIFGYPIVFNYVLIVPFVLLPVISLSVAYFATSLGLVSRCVIMTPWTTPPLVNAFLATGGDWRSVVLQFAIIVFGVLFFIPFIKINDSVQLKAAVASKETAK